ncbi:MAG: N-acetylmuramoyl-L-alanine amidase, partial [bacterium]
EGRVSDFAGDTNTTYDPKGHLLVKVTGDFEKQPFTPELHTSLVHLLAYLCQQYDISPDTIKGHKDLAATGCPGEDLYKYIRDGSLAVEVKDYMRDCAEMNKEAQK